MTRFNKLTSTMNDFLTYCNKISMLSQDATKDFNNRLKTKTFLKGSTINKEGEICNKLYFIDKGLVKHYYYLKGRIYILRFFSENSIFTALDSFTYQLPAQFITVALEDTSTIYISFKDVEELCKKHHSFETLIRKLYSWASIDVLKQLKNLIDNDATEKYNVFVSENNHLMQRISLGDVASYLGISQVSLSRIRSKK